MKKLIGALLLSLLVFSVGAIAFADGSEKTPNWFNEMIEWKKDRVENAVTEGILTQEEADEYIEHFHEMEAYHEENGFPEEGYGFGMGLGKENGRRGQRGFSRGCGY
ncbi:DUF2680 domain-containing protein [Clostridium sp. D2Q-14]|uniref:DUF2680 domain-containing protein n=1 Tax=Anaeromonas gelatinilytica TaxID=2683194 RepID=UPI00193B732B|nr:DUF2680 domain-containing protein [Anaeromonas gelatinilytica]MBS4534873.1 DUF2680 domain-containing protein [Anaeromonas gelatinilytica]